MYSPYHTPMSAKENAICWAIALALTGAAVVVVCALLAGVQYLTRPSDAEIARSQAYFDTVNAASIARICADGTRVYSTSRGQLFVPQPWGAQIIPVTGPAESVCSR